MVTSYGQLWWGVTPNVTVVTQPLQLDTIPTEVRLNGLRILYQRLQFRNNNGQSGRNKGQAPDQTIPQGITWDSLSGSFNLPIGLRLPHNQNTVNIDFNTNDVRSRDQIVYTYMLEGEDSGWCRPTPIPESKTYFNLSAGKYSFRVKAKGANGIWGPVATISFEVLKPWWIQWWALILYLGALALFTWLVSNYRARMLKKENSQLEKRVNERTVALENSIQELKTTQAQMIQREKMASLGELTAGIAHEIQNPLNFVNNFSEVNQELLIDLQTEIDKGNDKAVVELLQDLHSNNVKINQHGKRADSIIKSMLQHSRSSSGDKESTDLNALCDEYLQLSYHGMRAKEKDFNVKIHSTLAKDLPLVRMVPQDIGRVLMNLLNNAFYAARKSKKTGQPGFEPQVSLTTATQERMVTISITDNGDGIPEDLMKKIFQPFFTTKPTGEGTGLGLSLSFDIITKGHGGQLQVQTEPGMGTTFIISLPKS
jgi:signal transduction histidine kinase